MKRWSEHRNAIVPIFIFSKEVRKIICTSNAIESLNSGYRKLNRQRSVFPNDRVLLKTAAGSRTKAFPQRNNLPVCKVATGAFFTTKNISSKMNNCRPIAMPSMTPSLNGTRVISSRCPYSGALIAS